MYTVGGKIIKGLTFFLLLLCLVLPALPALAGSGIGLSPASIDITDAMRGSSYDKNLSIYNTGDNDCEYTLTLDGAAASWISLSYQGDPLDGITIAANNKKIIDVAVSVPGDAANGNYTGNININSVPVSSGSGGGAGLSLGGTCRVNVAVTGTQNISGKVDGVTVQDQETGLPVLFNVFFENNGNVAVSPSIDVAINWEGKPADNFNYSDATVGPTEKDQIEVKWDTTGHAPGDYTAKVNVSLEGKQIYTHDVSFKILPLGSLTRSGELREININGTPPPGGLAKISGVFANTGSADVLAKLTGEIYYNGSLSGLLQGDEVMVNRGSQSTLSAYFTPEKEGEYNFKCQVDFGGIKTEVKELTIDVKAAPTTTINTISASQTTEVATPPATQTTQTETSAGNGFNLSDLPWLYIGGGVGLVLIIIVVLFLNSKR